MNLKSWERDTHKLWAQDSTKKNYGGNMSHPDILLLWIAIVVAFLAIPPVIIWWIKVFFRDFK